MSSIGSPFSSSPKIVTYPAVVTAATLRVARIADGVVIVLGVAVYSLVAPKTTAALTTSAVPVTGVSVSE